MVLCTCKMYRCLYGCVYVNYVCLLVIIFLFVGMYIVAVATI